MQDMNSNHHPFCSNGGAPLPDTIVSLQQSMEWSLTKAPPPMCFLSLEQLEDDDTGNVLDTVALLVQHSPTNKNNDTESKNSDSKDHLQEIEYWARIATALLWLGHGYTDQAHNLVGPLSYPQPLPYFYGPPIACSKGIVAAASAVHCLVHRREGFNQSEFGKTGLDNSHYWAGATMRSGGEETLPLNKLQEAVKRTVEQYIQKQQQQVSGGSAQAQQQQQETQQAALDWWNAAHRDYYAATDWDPRPVTELCGVVLEHNAAASQTHSPHPLQKLAEEASLAEVCVLLRHALTQLGYDNATTTSDDEEEECANHISFENSVTASTALKTCSAETTTESSSPPSELPPFPQKQQQVTQLPQTMDQVLQQHNNTWQDVALVVTTAKAPHRIVHVNDAWVQLCGFSTAQQAIGQTFKIIQGPATQTNVAAEMVSKSLQTGRQQDGYLINYTANTGQGFLNHLTIAPLWQHPTNQEQPEYMVGVLEKVKDLPGYHLP